MTPDQQNHLRAAIRTAGPKVQRHLYPLMPEAVISFAGVEMLVHPRDNYTERCIWYRGHPPEVESLAKLTEFVSGRRVLFLDIGANCGAYSIPLAKAAAEGSVFQAFEPNPVMIGRLGENVRRNDLGRKICIQGCALGAEDGEAELALHKSNFGQASLATGHQKHVSGRVRVPVRPLAPFLEGADTYDLCLLKIDVEGFEPQVLLPWLDQQKGANLPSAILIETAHSAGWSGDLFGSLADAGYETRFEGEGNTLYVAKSGKLG